MKLKTILPILTLALVMISCGGPKGELTGAYKKVGNFKEANPYGMVFIKAGNFNMGGNTQSAIFEQTDNVKHVTVNSFWMDETEITNNEYRQFVDWVRDSIALRLMVIYDGAEADETGFKEYAWRYDQLVGGDDAELNEEYAFNDTTVPLDWKKLKKLKTEFQKAYTNRMALDEDDPAYHLLEAQKELYYSQFSSLKTTRLHYSYSWTNYDQAVLPENKYDVARGCYPPNATSRVDISWEEPDEVTGDLAIYYKTVTIPLREPKDLLTHKIISVYPDTMVWKRDFMYSFNDPYLEEYFTHEGYRDYPVVGVTWEQAHAFCHWRTKYLRETGVDVQCYRLPTEAEWEWAARGGRKMAAYPWGSNYARDAQGCFFANFKPYHGAYDDDTGCPLMAVAKFRPNDFGLFDMGGNVAEWTATTYTTTNNEYVHDLNPDYQYMARYDDPDVIKRKVIKGGSWKDISAYLQCGARTYEYYYEDRNYIGFRCVRSHIGD